MESWFSLPYKTKALFLGETRMLLYVGRDSGEKAGMHLLAPVA